jgi:Bacterial mobilisation protein (MobC)
MPTRGYRKGISDTKQPVPHSIRTHVTAAEFACLLRQCDARSLTLSKLLRTLVTAFVRGQRAELPQPRGLSNAALRELCRIGNNLNQLAKQANTGIVPVDAATLRATLARVLDAVRRLG